MEKTDCQQLNPRLLLPERIYVTVGRELNIWKDAIVLMPEGYTGVQINFFCDVGLNKKRGFRFKPEEPGEYTLTVTVDDVNGQNLETKKTIISAVPNCSGSGTKNLLFIGDSLFGGGQIAEEVRNLILKDGRFKPELIGSEGKHPVCHEGRGGYRFDHYATKGQRFFRFEVTGIKSPFNKPVYQHHGFKFYGVEHNITDGTGYISCVSDSPVATVENSGTLEKESGQGDSEISFHNYEITTFNPFWNDEKNCHDFQKYLADRKVSGNLDFVFIQLGNNDIWSKVDSASVKKIIQYAKDLLSQILSAKSGFPEAKIILGLPTAGGSQDGFGINYGASANVEQIKSKTRVLSEALVKTFDRGAFSKNVRLSPNILWIDRYYGYPRAETQVSDRETTLIEEHTNGGHPSLSGYQQMADAFYSTMRSFL